MIDPAKFRTKRLEHIPLSHREMPVRVRVPSVCLEVSLARERLAEWEILLVDDGDLVPDWVVWWMQIVSSLESHGARCAIAYLSMSGRRFLQASPRISFSPLGVDDLVALLADRQHWGLPSQGGLCWAQESPVSDQNQICDGCVLPGEGYALMIGDETALARAVWWTDLSRLPMIE